MKSGRCRLLPVQAADKLPKMPKPVRGPRSFLVKYSETRLSLSKQPTGRCVISRPRKAYITTWHSTTYPIYP